MNDWPNAAEARLLAALEPPPMRTGFGARVAARLPEASVAVRHDRRGGWRRGRAVLLGSVAAALLSVGAAASGVLGSRIQNLPVISTIATVASTTPASPKPKFASVKLPSKPVRKVQPGEKADAPVPQPVDSQSLEDSVAAAQGSVAAFRQERRAERIERRIAARAAHRAELGLPAATPEQQQRWREQMLARAERMREGRLASGQIATVSGNRFALQQARRERRRAFVESLTPEQRAEFRARQEARRERRAALRRNALENPSLVRRESAPQSLDEGAELTDPRH